MARKKIINESYSDYFRIVKRKNMFENMRDIYALNQEIMPFEEDYSDYDVYRNYLVACLELFNNRRSLRETCRVCDCFGIYVNRSILDRFIHQEIPKINKDFYNDLCKSLKLNKRYTSSKKYKGKEDLS